MIPRSLHNIHLTSQYRLAPCQHDYSASDVARFWAKVNSAGKDGCWLWTASSMDTSGHGQFTVRRDGKQFHLYAHRVVWELTRGPIPAGLVICHSCDIPPCVNPDHLFIGTQADNLADARLKGRLREYLPRTFKFTPDERLRIFQLPARRGLVTELAKQYGVTKTAISRIRAGLFTRPDVFERVPFVNLRVRGEVA